MITISNYQNTLVPFTLFENTTFALSATTYILELYGDQLHDTTLLFLTGDTSNNVNRYNYFPINLTPYNLLSGQYDYRVFQNTGTTLSLSALTINDIVESGSASIISSGTTSIPTFVPNNQTQYIFQ